MLELYRGLVGLRRAEAAVASGDPGGTSVRVRDGAVVLTRSAGGAGRVDVVLVVEEGPVSVVVERDGGAARVVLDSGVVLGGEAARMEVGPGGTVVTVSGPGVVVLR